MTAIDKGNQLRALGLSLLFIAMALGSLARSLHLAEPAALAMNVASGVTSLTAIALFYKAAPGARRRVLIVTIAGMAVATMIATFVILHH